MKQCTRCGETKPLDEFHRHRGRSDGRYSQCRTCSSEVSRTPAVKAAQARYQQSAKRQRTKSAFRQRHAERLRVQERVDSIRRRRERRAWLDHVKLAAGCIDCGYNAHPRALDFDHVGTDKVGNVGQMAHDLVAMSILLAEIAKCEVVCANLPPRTHRRARAAAVNVEPRPKTGYQRREDAAVRKRQHVERMNELRPVVFARAGYRCEACGRRDGDYHPKGHRLHLEPHHRLMRSQHGPDTLENLMALCDPGGCHDLVHANPTWGYDNGLLIRSHTGPPTEPWAYPEGLLAFPDRIG